jgi:hypothetical protein
MQNLEEVVREAIMMHSSPSIDRSDAHGCRGQTAYHVVENHVQFIARAIAEKLAAEQLNLRVCRGCGLSGGFYDLASRIPRPPNRMGSNPLLDIAEKYDLPLDVVYSYAWRMKGLMTNRPGALDETWGLQARRRVVGDRMGMKAAGEIAKHIQDFVELQGSSCN